VSTLPDVRVLDPAVEPRRPAADYAPLLILLAAMASFGLAVMGVTIRDKMDPKVRYPEQITGRMQLQILGAVPHVSCASAPTATVRRRSSKRYAVCDCGCCTLTPATGR